MKQRLRKVLPDIYSKLYQHSGHRNWWPADTPFEVAVGAILTQNTAWTNVEYAISNLKSCDLLSPQSLNDTPLKELERLIRPAGFFRQKAHRIQSLSAYLIDNWGGDIVAACTGQVITARDRLLALHGIGPETADSILLYAANRPSFVVDSYTRRIFCRFGLLRGHETYQHIRQMFMHNLPEDVPLYKDYHAQIVHLAKTCCHKSQPLCSQCPLNTVCGYALALKSLTAVNDHN